MQRLGLLFSMQRGSFRDMLNTKRAVVYTIFGLLSTALNIFTFIVLNDLVGLSALASNAIASLAAILFAFFTNRKYVFESSSSLKQEILRFFSSRSFTMIVETLLIYISVDLLKQSAFVFKLISNAIVIILNYILSSVWVFKIEGECFEQQEDC